MRSKLLSAIALPTLILALSLSISTLTIRPASANVGLPMNQVVQALRRVRIPLLIPEILPFRGEGNIYWRTSVKPKGYSIEFIASPDCDGTYCYIGSFSAEQGGNFDQGSSGDIVEGVTLAKGKKAQYRLFRGAYYNAFLSWKERGVLYTVVVKNGDKEKVMQIANSAINGGFRN
ncbi:hypothetical protein NIES2135_25160 [Leptolyngbya boryana NIES-2135]|jgi:hypothetical protein|uniref:DUF4367 domain-containing protein n=1 Tax=Leptolyngbya boryana NIES-2135 TaxID=1973484 RepID=A0A1Z4JG03_LEPBY|nr:MULTISPECIES: hypothetical protein [Leptolyngbya]BAY55692.1 hypothetical protein NIES2135_25160 [Leptolyngbya boryana NIES-2135]MBD2371599.1 hypothetical protein [Leptolyngbya sp. FACHB-161]MBD2378150.1 hypothetical protein [Leptolyngbya sp. FACHB-238]MBD2402554.1 hypothetical protein [Leptolyngbya sp. FACHB-239]MBD2409079.1 hypothetical protein [Leptolyngbya sp. FACHB-402]